MYAESIIDQNFITSDVEIFIKIMGSCSGYLKDLKCCVKPSSVSLSSSNVSNTFRALEKVKDQKIEGKTK